MGKQHKRKNKEINVKSPYICPSCGEKNYSYTTKTGYRKGIDVGEYIFEGFFNSHNGEHYHCNTCGYSWDVRIDK